MHAVDYHMNQNDSHLGSKLTEGRSTITTAMAAMTNMKYKLLVYATSTVSSIPFSLFIMIFQSKVVQKLPLLILSASCLPCLCTLQLRLTARNFARYVLC